MYEGSVFSAVWSMDLGSFGLFISGLGAVGVYGSFRV